MYFYNAQTDKQFPNAREHKVNKKKKKTTPIDNFGPVIPGWKTFTHSHPGVQASEDFRPADFPHLESRFTKFQRDFNKVQLEKAISGDITA